MISIKIKVITVTKSILILEMLKQSQNLESFLKRYNTLTFNFCNSRMLLLLDRKLANRNHTIINQCLKQSYWNHLKTR